MSAIIAAGVGLGAAAIGQGVYGISQNSKASAIEKSNIRPTMSVDPLYQQNVNSATQLAQQGIAAPAYNNQLNSINQNQAGAISALNNSANSGAGLASIVRQGNNATNSLNAEDAAARNKNTLLMLQQKGILAGANQNAWNYNYANKYSEGLAKSQALRGAAAQNIGGAFNTLASGATSYLGGMNGSGKAAKGVQGNGNLVDNNYQGIYNNMA